MPVVAINDHWQSENARLRNIPKTCPHGSASRREFRNIEFAKESFIEV